MLFLNLFKKNFSNLQLQQKTTTKRGKYFNSIEIPGIKIWREKEEKEEGKVMPKYIT